LSRYTVGRFTPVAFAIWAILVAPLPRISRTVTNCARVNAGCGRGTAAAAFAFGVYLLNHGIFIGSEIYATEVGIAQRRRYLLITGIADLPAKGDTYSELSQVRGHLHALATVATRSGGDLVRAACHASAEQQRRFLSRN
jgi:hypothetical protein